MKKIIALVLVAVLAVFALAACAPVEPVYTVVVGVDRTEEEGAVVDTVVLLVLDEDGKIVKASIDTLEVKSSQTAAQLSKKAKGDDYGMKKGNGAGYGSANYEWYEQAAAYEAALVGKTKDEALALEAKAGVLETTCTIGIEEFEAAVANAFESANKKTVKVAESVAVELALTSTYTDGAFSINYVATATVGEEKVLHIVKSATGHNEAGELLNYNCGVSITKPISGNSSNANVAIFEADIMYVSVDAIDDIQITFNSVSTSPILGLFRPVAKEAGSAIKNNGSTGTTSGETSAKVGEWFHLRIEYRVTETNADGAPTSIEVKYFIGDDVIVSTTAYKTPLRLSELTKASLSFNKLNKGEYYVDNVCFRLDYVEPVAQ